MELGRHLRELTRLQVGFVVCLLLASFAAISANYKVGLFPPKLSSRSLELAAASTEVLVDTPRTTLLDLRQDTYDIESITNRAVLVGNVMASPPVLQYIGRRAGVDPSLIKATTPLTPDFPRPFATPGNEKKTGDLFKSTNQFRLNIQANPTVPVLKIYAQAPTVHQSEELANAAVDGMGDYLKTVGTRQKISKDTQVRLEQLGRAEGADINKSVNIQAAVVAFVLVFGASAAAIIFIGRVRKGFRQADELKPAGAGAR